MFSSAVSVGMRLYAWKMKPTRVAPQRRQRVVLELRTVRVADPHLARGGPVEAGEAVHERGLARPGRTHDRR